MPKVLIISHNPLTTYESMGKTLTTLFSSFQREELCQLYVYPTVPNVDRCSSYYRITDKDVLYSYYKFKVNGRPVEPDVSQSRMFEAEGDEQIYRNPRNKRSEIMLLRDLMWKCSRWYTEELKAWLQNEKPDCIFAAPGAAMFLYDMAMTISEDLNIPIISYLCDEYYFVDAGGEFWRRKRIRLLKRKIEQYMAKTAHVITICDELQKPYFARFRRPMTTVMTGSSFPIAAAIRKTAHPGSITYMGNVRCNRYTSIAEIGNALAQINSEEGTRYCVNVYSGEKDRQILDVLKAPETVNLCGFVSGEEFDRVLHCSDFLLHTESFDEDYIDVVKNSVSTKIADSLGSGIPLIAYGPDSIASMRHLIRNQCAITITDRADLVATLREAFSNQKLRDDRAENGLDTARKYHEPRICADLLRQVVERVAADK